MKLVAVSGLPNTGKTSLFNALTKSRARVANYPGVTVERRSARCVLSEGEEVELLDVPGAYSLVARSADEQISFEATLGLGGLATPDLVVACVDATSPLRGLYYALQLRELGVQAIIALTMMDEAGETLLSAEDLAVAIGYPVIPIDARRGRGLDRVRRAISRGLAAAPPAEKIPWSIPADLAERIEDIRPALPPQWQDREAMALWALMSVSGEDELERISPELRAAVARHETDGPDIDLAIIRARYSWLKERVDPLIKARKVRLVTERLDSVLVNGRLGLVAFLAIMLVLFQALFAWCDPVITLIERAFEWAGGAAAQVLPEGLFADLIVNGIIAGVGAVLVFIPQILLLFFFIGLLEDVGYMARVAVLMDRIMSKMNLNGRAFVPMLSGFACAVPAILATRTMERRRDRYLTMMVVPLMTCSARLPVYSLIIAALIPPSGIFGVPTQGLLMVAMYLFSVFTALAAAWVLSRTLPPLRGKRLPLVIELPPYRLPRLRDVVRMMWERTALFVREAGTVILVCTVVLWALLAFPRGQTLPDDATPELERAAAAQQIENSYAGRIGHAIEPVISPLGFDWKIGIGIIGAFAAREVFVSTMGVVYAADGDDEDTKALRDKLRDEKKADGTSAYTPIVGLSLMVFFALACQCMSTLAVVKRETRSYRWPAFLFAYMTALAWLMSLFVFQIGRALGL